MYLWAPMETTQMLSDKAGEAMGRPQQEEDPNARPPPPPSYAAQAPAPPQYPPGEAPQQYPPATAPHEAAPRSPYPFPLHQQQPYPPPPPQPAQAHFQPASFPPQEPVQPAVRFPPVPEQCYQPPATYPPSGPQQFNQTPTPVAGVPYQKPYVAPPAVCGPGAQFAPWSTGLFDCLDDPTNALITLCFPCVTFGQVAEILDNGQTSCATSAMMYGAIALCFGVPWILSCTYRTKLRAKYGLMETPAPDWLTHCFCDYCAICQEYRELRNRGLDPGIGWYANTMLQAQQQQAAMAPPANQAMRLA